MANTCAWVITGFLTGLTPTVLANGITSLFKERQCPVTVPHLVATRTLIG